jgi:hypothetical protein
MYFHRSAMLKEVLTANEITDGTPIVPNNDDKRQTDSMCHACMAGSFAVTMESM